ncbi:hypothetical protein [Sulfitobacter pontiacus]|jgi:hypothetical protein|uniref:hypothetical protein n=1 Tax=Sulfitobacter pontiacus TaxID=60137 RepID=UPI0030EE1EF1
MSSQENKGLETKAFMGSRALMPRFSRIRAALGIAGICLGLASSATLAQPEVIRCLAPAVPITALPEDVLAEYRAEISAEFEAYFSAVGDYIACHDDERARVLAEATVATTAYAAFLQIPSN